MPNCFKFLHEILSHTFKGPTPATQLTQSHDDCTEIVVDFLNRWENWQHANNGWTSTGSKGKLKFNSDCFIQSFFFYLKKRPESCFKKLIAMKWNRPAVFYSNYFSGWLVWCRRLEHSAEKKKEKKEKKLLWVANEWAATQRSASELANKGFLIESREISRDKLIP